MKYNKLAILLAMALSLVAVSCNKEIVQKPLYPTNVGEEYIEVTVDSLAFQGRGGSMNFTVSASYDVTVTADEWITLSSLTLPGDKREYVLTATTSANKGDGAKDREGRIYISTTNLQEEIVVTQPFYNRPDIANPIKTAEEFKFFIEEGAPYIESGEVIAIASDIDMKDVTLAASAEYFNGVLEGAGCTIRNMSGSLPLFAKLNEGASISNLAIDGEYVIGTVADEVKFGPFVGLNYGTISGCVNNASITANGDYVNKVYLGGIAGYTYAAGDITSCVNKGKISYAATSSTANAYLGGITAYSYGDITDCETYGPIRGEASSFSAVYFIGGISPRHEAGALTGNIVHKEAKVYTNENSGTGKSYIGGVIGYLEGAPATGKNKLFADVEVNLKVEAYIGGLQGWQAKVDNSSMPNATLFEGSVVNSNITAYTPGQGKNGNNPCFSAGFVTGRFSGQKGKATTLHYGNADDPIKISGSITCLKTNTKSIATAKDYQALLDGDGSVTSVNAGAITETDYNTIAYEVVGDGQEGPAEDLIVKTGSVKLSVPFDGGDASFTIRGNYTMTVKSDAPWIKVSDGKKDKTTGELVFVEELTVEGDGTYYDIIVRGDANDHTYAREGKVLVSMPMGSTEAVAIAQAGNTTLPAFLNVDATEVALDPAGQTASKVNVSANYDATVAVDVDWVEVTPATIVGDEQSHSLSILAQKNKSGAARTATVTITNKNVVKTIALSQDKFVVPAYSEIKNAAEFVEFIENAFDTELYPEGKETKLLADIDLKGISFAAPATYAGVLNGNGKSIKNWVSEAPLVTDLKGTITNLKIDATCSTTAATNISYFTANNNGTIENCVNNAALKSTVVPTASTRIAVFACYNFGTIKGCTNNGAVTFEPETEAGIAVYLSGITASLSGGTVENCTNNGKVSFCPAALTAKAYHRVAGIASICVKNTLATIKNCKNTKNATISIVDPSGLVTNAYAGNIAAEIEAKGAKTVEDCSGFADVSTNVKNDNSKVGGLVGTISKFDTATTLLAGCVVNCNVTGLYKTTKTDVFNFLNSCAMIVGRLGGESKAVMSIGSAEKPVKVSGTLNMLASEGVEAQSATISAENLKNLAIGNGSGTFDTTGTTYQVVNAKYEVVTKE